MLKATVDVPWAGEVNVDCTQLDHLNEKWRMKQICAIIQSNDSPHILAGGLNSLDGSDYSAERWMDIVKVKFQPFQFSPLRSRKQNLPTAYKSKSMSLLLNDFQYYEDIGKPTPRVEVMKLLKGIEYVDSKEFAGECEPVVIIAKGQSK